MKNTKQILKTKLELLANHFNKKVGYKLGNWFLDYNDVYGGWLIVEMMENGGEWHPFTNRRHKASEINDMMDFALSALKMRENGNQL